MTGIIEIIPVNGVGEITPREDIARTLLAAMQAGEAGVRAGDVVVVTQKIVSKAEGRFVDLRDVHPGVEACALARKTNKDPRLVELVLRESTMIVRAAPEVLIARHHLGFVMANAGIDQSNIGPGRDDHVLLLPKDPDATAERLSRALTEAVGGPVAVVISDSFGRPWRNGVVNVAIGAYGLGALVDKRGSVDRDGRTLEVTQVAVADLIASAAGLAGGEGAESAPAIIVRGVAPTEEWSTAAQIIRPQQQDLFL
ncbi:MAG: coenzyme F420-0:L-glutamate ligase [Pseudomonadota bacterium]|nr:coenzyme F420-0:L-glutamate ligase [Pseudomonadota bacterium]